MGGTLELAVSPHLWSLCCRMDLVRFGVSQGETSPCLSPQAGDPVWAHWLYKGWRAKLGEGQAGCALASSSPSGG